MCTDRQQSVTHTCKKTTQQQLYLSCCADRFSMAGLAAGQCRTQDLDCGCAASGARTINARCQRSPLVQAIHSSTSQNNHTSVQLVCSTLLSREHHSQRRFTSDWFYTRATHHHSTFSLSFDGINICTDMNLFRSHPGNTSIRRARSHFVVFPRAHATSCCFAGNISE